MLNDQFLKKTLSFWRLSVFLFGVLISIDQVSKIFAKNIYLNHNFAFSLPVPIYLMYTIYFAGIGTIIFYLFKQHGNLSAVDFFAWLMILAGAVSNVGERIILGFVRDWVYILNGVFNLADFYIILGVIILIIKIPIYE